MWCGGTQLHKECPPKLQRVAIANCWREKNLILPTTGAAGTRGRSCRTGIRSKHPELLLPKLNAACYAMRTIKPFMSQETLKMVYHAYFHSIMNYGLIFWGNSSHSVNIFKIL
jgi:hypothetical protein